MALTLTLTQKTLILVGVPVLFELAVVTVLFSLQEQTEKEVARESHARQVSAAVFDIIYDLWSAFSGGGVSTLPRNLVRIDKYSPDEIPRHMKHLEDLVGSNAREYRSAMRAEFLLQQALPRYIDLRRLAENQPIAALVAFGQFKRDFEPKIEVVLNALNGILAEEQRIEIESPKIQAGFRRGVHVTLWIAVAMNILLAVLLGIYFNRGTLKRLRVVLENTRLLAANKPLKPELEGADEIAHLDHVFHEMATALAEAVRKERAAIENAVDVICSLNADASFTAVSPAARKLWGYEPAELVGRSCYDFLVAEDAGQTRERFRQAIAGGGEAATSFETRLVRKDGSPADLLWSAHWSDSEKSLFCVAHDITERKEVERMKQEFVAMVSHDLRTPLTSIQAMTSMFADGIYGPISEAGREVLARVRGNVMRLISLVNDLLDVEKMESGHLQLNLKSCSLSEIVSRCLDAVGGYASQQGVNLQADPSEARVYADPDRLVQVLVNLVGNAVKFSPRDSLVRISVLEQDGFVETRVQDSGPGIPSAYRESVFDKFKQVRASDATEKKGSGLGLAICKAIVELHGGTIGVESEEGKGSTFWFRIPLQSDNGSQTP